MTTPFFNVVLDRNVSIGLVGSRAGFYDYEDIGLCWIKSPVATIGFRSCESRLCVHINVYRISADYPIRDIILSLNHVELQYVPRIIDGNWAWLETQPFFCSTLGDELSIEIPFLIPAAFRDPKTKESRRLGVALSGLVFKSAYA